MIYKEERIALFVDGRNLHAAAKTLGIDLDYKRLLHHFATSARLVRASYFTAICETDDHQPMQPLVDWMQFNGWNVVTKSAHEFTTDDGQRKVKGNITVDLTVDAIALAPHIDHAVLITGDGNLCPLVRHLQSMGTRVTIMSTMMTQPPMAANDLRRQADAFIELDTLRTAIERPIRNAAA